VKILNIYLGIWIFIYSFSVYAEPSDKVVEFISILEVAADEGDDVANYHLGNIYMEGLEGVKKDYKKGFHYLMRASKSGYARAQYNLAASYKLGEGTTQSREEALHWYALAAAQGHAKAQLQAALIYQENGFYSKAQGLLNLAARQGLVDAQFILAGMFQIGKGTPQNYRSAYIWYSIAAANGDSDAARLRDGISKELDSETLSEAQNEAGKIFASIGSNE